MADHGIPDPVSTPTKASGRNAALSTNTPVLGDTESISRRLRSSTSKQKDEQLPLNPINFGTPSSGNTPERLPDSSRLKQEEPVVESPLSKKGNSQVKDKSRKSMSFKNAGITELKGVLVQPQSSAASNDIFLQDVSPLQHFIHDVSSPSQDQLLEKDTTATEAVRQLTVTVAEVMPLSPIIVAEEGLGLITGSDIESSSTQPELEVESESFPDTPPDESSAPLPEEDVPVVDQLDLMPFGNPKEIDVHNYDMYNFIISKRVKNPKHCLELGWVYIFDSPNAPKCVKIGKTKLIPAVRMKVIEKECHIKLSIVADENTTSFLHYQYLEHLVHLALHAERQKYKENCTKCPGKYVHQEWFEVSHKKALKEIEIWRNWIVKQKPFNADGTLTDYWYWRAKKLPASLNRISWEQWTQPGGIGCTDYQDYEDFCKEKLQKVQDYLWCRFRAHVERKDERFWSNGALLLLVASYYGFGALLYTGIALCAL